MEFKTMILILRYSDDHDLSFFYFPHKRTALLGIAGKESIIDVLLQNDLCITHPNRKR